MRVKGLILAAAFAFVATAASAQPSVCARSEPACASACAALCGGGESCAACAEADACRSADAACDAEDGAASGAAPMAAPQIAPAAPSAAASELSPRVLFLVGRFEPIAAYYGYLAIGADVDRARREAVARALGCAVDSFGDGSPDPSELALIALPATGAGPAPSVGGAATPPEEIIDLYDAVRGQRWLRAAGFALGESFDADRAILFIGSRRPRAQQLDSVALPAADPNVDPMDPVFADASGLEPSGLEAWTMAVIDGVRSGAVRSRQDYQSWMEAYAWVEWASSPVTGLFTVTRASAAPPIACG